VVIEVLQSDTNVRPGMTTSNRILTRTIRDTLVIPIEAVFSQDSISFVYLKNGLSIEKKQVRLGDANENEVVVAAGVQVGDQLMLTEPEGMKEKKIVLLPGEKSKKTAARP
jgi:HlyD family secretion protein